MNPIVIIGSGLAGYGLLRELNQRHCPHPRLLITADGGESYYKPALSSALGQKKTPADLAMAQSSTMAQELNAEILTHTRVTGIDPANHRLTLASGETRPYGKLVLALGSSPIRLPLTGDGANDVLSVNNLDDYTRFRERLTHARKVAIIGPGLIGSEFANDLLQSQRDVTIIGPDPWPISTLIPQTAGEAVRQAMAAKGAVWHLETFNGAIEKTAPGYRTTLKNGTVVEADLVLSAVGIRPEIQLATQAGLKTQRGIVTDALLQTSDPDIYAVGDCAEVEGRNLPFVQPLMIGIRALASTLMGQPREVRYPAMPVAIKTTLHPIITLPPQTKEGNWTFDGTPATGILGRFIDPNGKLAGFVLTGSRTPEKTMLMQALAA
ncbi:MAG: FAD-dependent oxidoreductase [Magnetococcales bacterium]|nr:FAD-dependent oxidoreductase [Magnetococcales bacterium]MBF0149143.1 FAD-dependent oxidoreductase [Magnetococcales bacterium]MBF0172350.1 FAD-dependent oxidoreductase [Magnetococcales bacterium]MBF0629664.1 FAD-dependent oxidoreductase [Magnetococcales bacterium]